MWRAVMSELDDWHSETDSLCPRHAFDAGQQYQQPKIDLLEKELTETQAFLNNQNHIKQAKIDELQAMVDILEATNDSLVAYKNQLLDELKGNKDEN